METRLFIQNHKPATASAANIGGTVWLEFKQGDDVVALVMPARMEAVSHMIAEAFNAHMDERKSAPVEVPGFPSGGALSAEGALVVAAVWVDPITAKRDFSYADLIAELKGRDLVGDDAASHAVERRDLP